MAMMHFSGLWADGWFYLSAGGFLASAILFVYFLSNYRAAVEAEDEEFLPEPEAESAAEEAAPILHEKSPAHPEPAAIAAPEPEAGRAPATVADASVHGPFPAAAPDAAREVEAGLKNLEGRLGRRLSALESELGELKSVVDSEAEQGRQILKRLDEFSALKEAVRASAETGETVIKRIAELSKSLAAVEKRSAPAPQPAQAVEIPPEAKPSAEKPPADKAEKKAEPAPEPVAKAEPAQAESSKTQAARKTPVWPI
ncbi:MAG: hypothetical protein KGL04_09120 [Elusimicrobia bacterium]|nr:hypothetical protein [Elusimicrobiota bacterium]